MSHAPPRFPDTRVGKTLRCSHHTPLSCQCTGSHMKRSNAGIFCLHPCGFNCQEAQLLLELALRHHGKAVLWGPTIWWPGHCNVDWAECINCCKENLLSRKSPIFNLHVCNRVECDKVDSITMMKAFHDLQER